MFKAVITTVVMALSEKQKNCSSDKTTTVCGDSSESLQLPTKPHSRGCESTYNKVLFTPPTMCRLTLPPRGSTKAKMLQVPSRTYSESTFRLLPGLMGSGSRTSPKSWYGFSSMHTTGISGLYGSSYTSRTSSMHAMNSESSFLGRHQ